jgi:hypothetical protein
MLPHPFQQPISRRVLLQRVGTGMGMLGLASILNQQGLLAADAAPASPLSPKAPHFPAKAKHVIHLFMNGGPSQVDTFDPKPSLEKYHGQKPPAGLLKTERATGSLLRSPFKFQKYGQAGIEISEL